MRLRRHVHRARARDSQQYDGGERRPPETPERPGAGRAVTVQACSVRDHAPSLGRATVRPVRRV
ncbi:hypothetical protein GCM10010372_30210 [Streptomyces tauricus]|nr:hypothetical protein GCM10010372_30210 [Streptomyces tauricus]